MSHDNFSTGRSAGMLLPQTMYRGLYVRIAKKLGVDPSYVSRVARGERFSDPVESALRQEVHQITKKLGGRLPVPEDRPAHRGQKRLGSLVKRHRNSIRRDWLHHSQSDPGHRRLKLSAQKRTSPVLPLVDEALRSMKFTPKEMAHMGMRAATQHGRLRRAQGYTTTGLVEDYNLIRRCISALAEKNLSQLDAHLLLHDLSQLSEALDIQLQHALRKFLARA
jgi:transcriptional regulator with XRE-family HTH domain